MQRHYVNSFEIALDASGASDGTPIEMPRTGMDVAIEQISITAVTGAGAVAAGLQLVQFSDLGGTNRTMFVRPQLVRNLVGDGALPWALPVPWHVPGSARIACRAENLLSSAVTLYVTLQGQRLPPEDQRSKAQSVPALNQQIRELIEQRDALKGR